jgi:predicted TIM-barrel fold metal-dependent hydrolase
MDDIDARLKHMDELGVDVQVLYPTIFLRPYTRRPEVELAVTRSYNRWLIDIWKKAPARLRWVAVLPLLSMDEALKEARFAKQNGACGIFMRGLEGDKLLSDPHFFPMYEEAGRLDLPVCVHSATGSFDVHNFFLDESGFSKFKLAVVGSFHTLIFNDIPAKFPRTRFAFIEVSSQWVPYAIHDYARRKERGGAPVDKSDVLRKNRIWVACQTDDDLPYVFKYAGEDYLVIGTDYGHNDTSSEILALRKLKEDGAVPPHIVNKILDDNARALYGL